MPRELELDFYGQKALLRVAESSEEGALRVMERLARDFDYFLRAPGVSRGAREQALFLLSLDSSKSHPRPEKRLQPLFRTRMCRVYGWGWERRCEYGDGAWVDSRHGSGQHRFEIHSRTEADLYELTYLALLSCSGELLDMQRYHRIHALGFQADRLSGLLVLPMGGGKSALAHLLGKSGKIRIYSDESPLVRGNRIFPFPIRSALKPDAAQALGLDLQPLDRFQRRMFPEKLLFPIPPHLRANPAPVSLLLFGSQASKGAAPRIRPISRVQSFFSLLIPLVIGAGLAQMSEHMLRAENLVALARIALSRLRTAWSLSRSCGAYRFEVSRDAFLNSRILAEFIEKQKEGPCHG